jgi:hypothetical protein
MWFMREDDVDPFKDSLQVLIDAGWRQDAERTIEELVFAADVNPHIGTLWVERRAAVRYAVRRFHGFERVLATGAAGQYAAQALLRHHKVKKNVRALRRLLRRYREEFTRNDETYGLVGFALVGNNLVCDAAAWFVDWRAHSGLEPWMLLNLAGALRDLGRDAEAAEAGQRALTRPRDHTFNEHNIWLAVDAGFAGDRANAERLLANVDEKEISDYRRFLFRIAQALAAISGEQVPLSAVAYARAVDRLRGLFRLVPTFLKEPALYRYLGRALWRIVRARGGNTLAALGLWLYFVLVVIWLSPPAASAP